MKHILCYGDSNLFGTNPSGGRWAYTERWTGLLAQALGDGYRILEEGLGGRTTCFDDPLEGQRNGLSQLPIMLHSHRPLDLVILSLGTNDCKHLYPTNTRIITKALEKLALLARDYPYGDGYPKPQVLLISPIHIGSEIASSSYATFDEQSVSLSKSLAGPLQEMAERNNFLFLDAAEFASSSTIDQLHMDKESHARLAEAVLSVVLKYFGDQRPAKVHSEESVPLSQEKTEQDEPTKKVHLPRSFGFFKRRQ